MQKEIVLYRMKTLHDEEIQLLLNESVAEGHKFVGRLVEQHKDKTNTFSKEGEVLFGAYIDGKLVGVCGLNEDPYLQDPAIGRVRHLYVLQQFRRCGVGRLLMENIIQAARQHFRILTLWTNNPVADKLYCSLGFSQEERFFKATHFMNLD
jgi:GNAT superfamily N-acetyltransferase